MSKLIRIALLAVVVSVLIVPSVAAAPTARDPRVTVLQRQVRTLTAQVAALSARLAREEQLSKDRDTCLFALDRDSDRQLFHAIAAVVSYVTGNPPAPDLPRYDDQGACQRAGIERAP